MSTTCNYSTCNFVEVLGITCISGFIEVRYFIKEINFSTEYNVCS